MGQGGPSLDVTRPTGPPLSAIQNRRWRREQVRRLPAGVARAVLRQVEAHEQLAGAASANRMTSQLADELIAARVHTAFDEGEIEHLARQRADMCLRKPYQDAIAWTLTLGVRLPTGKHVTARGIHRRLCSPQWWRRAIRHSSCRTAEAGMRGIGRVNRSTSAYISEDSLGRVRVRRRAVREWIDGHELVSLDTGELLPLRQAVNASVANLALRRAELMTRISGLEEYAKANGHTGVFVTLTCPGAFHAYRQDASRNPKWNRATPGAARDWLQSNWAKARARFKRANIAPYGFRVSEPHHDGTPHWHLLLFGTAVEIEQVQRLLEHVWLSDFPDEEGAKKHRATFQVMDASRGTAAGYMAKYVAKNVDAHRFDLDDNQESDLAGSEAAERARAWASLNGFRQFQQIGGQPVTMWRELRRCAEPLPTPAVEAVRLAADGGHWDLYTERMPAARAAGLAYEREGDPTDRFSGPIRENQWGELGAPRLVGIRFLGEMERIVRRITRGAWRIVRRPPDCSSLGPVSITVRARESTTDQPPYAETATGPPRT